MTTYYIGYKYSYHGEDTYTYRGDLRGAMDIMRGMLAIPDVVITSITVEEGGEGQ